jgi:hypothetical protein
MEHAFAELIDGIVATMPQHEKAVSNMGTDTL